MALFKTLKHAFGFSDPELEEEELEGIDARVTPLRKRHEETAQASNEVNMRPDGNDRILSSTDASQDDDVPVVLPEAIFETVVALFNDAMPAFVKCAVDEKKQREYIYQALDASMKEYVERLGADAQNRCNRKWEAERNNLRMQIEDLRKKSQRDEEECSGSKKMQLSAERQKRALTERVHDLEKQLAAIEAENEQYILENKSLVNKIRLNTVIAESGVSDESLMDKLSELNAELETVKAENIVLTESNVKLEASVKNIVEKEREADVEIARLKEALDQSRVKDDLGDAMLSELNAKASEAQKMAVEKEQEAAKTLEALAAMRTEKEELEDRLSNISQYNDKLQTDLASANETIQKQAEEHAALDAMCANLKIERDAISEKLQEAMENLGIVEDMQHQLSSLEEARHANEAFLRKQRDDLMQKDELIRQLELQKDEYAETLIKKDETIHTLEDLADSLRKTIENNLYEHAQSQSALRSEIERLKSGPVSDPLPDATYDVMPEIVSDAEHETADARRQTKKRKNSRLKISAIDETLEDTDWLISTPPPSRKKDCTDDASQEFGYKEPSKKTTPDNPAQMSLW